MNTTSLVVLVLLVVIAGLGLMVWSRRAAHADNTADWPFRVRARVLSVYEQQLYWRLLEALPDYVVLVDVALTRLVTPAGTSNTTAWYARIRDRTVDFAVINPEGRLVAVIDLDRVNEDGSVRVRSDAVRDKALLAANVRSLRFRSGALPDVPTLTRQFGPGAPTTVKPLVGRQTLTTVPRASRATESRERF